MVMDDPLNDWTTSALRILSRHPDAEMRFCTWCGHEMLVLYPAQSVHPLCRDERAKVTDTDPDDPRWTLKKGEVPFAREFRWLAERSLRYIRQNCPSEDLEHDLTTLIEATPHFDFRNVGISDGYPLGRIEPDDALGQKMVEAWNNAANVRTSK
jgi:hypothetical protein